jgi:hypothetical protein
MFQEALHYRGIVEIRLIGANVLVNHPKRCTDFIAGDGAACLGAAVGQELLPYGPTLRRKFADGVRRDVLVGQLELVSHGRANDFNGRGGWALIGLVSQLMVQRRPTISQVDIAQLAPVRNFPSQGDLLEHSGGAVVAELQARHACIACLGLYSTRALRTQDAQCGRPRAPTAWFSHIAQHS